MPHVDQAYLQELELKARAYDQLNKDIDYIHRYIDWESWKDLKHLIKYLRVSIGIHSSFSMMRLADLMDRIFKIDWEETSSTPKLYYMNGLRHRDNGPAIERSNGDNEYYINGILHREDGPAIDFSNRKEWYYNGMRILVNSQKDFERELLLLNFK